MPQNNKIVIIRISGVLASPTCGTEFLYPMTATNAPTTVVANDEISLSIKEYTVAISPGT